MHHQRCLSISSRMHACCLLASTWKAGQLAVAPHLHRRASAPRNTLETHLHKSASSPGLSSMLAA